MSYSSIGRHYYTVPAAAGFQKELRNLLKLSALSPSHNIRIRLLWAALDGKMTENIDLINYMQHTPINGLMAFSQPALEMMIPIIAIVLGISMGAWTIYLSYRKRREMFALYHEERMAAIEKGIELPPLPEEFF